MSEPDRLDSIFWSLLELESTEQREQFIAQRCGQDAGFQQRVRDLLRAHQQSHSYLDDPRRVWSAAFRPDREADAGDEIGPYKLLQKIGEGGMGVVYMAQQTEPVRRRVAVKLIRPEMSSRQSTERFEAERQTLARMDHPNIARIFDAGMTQQGLPYFVMELVSGVPITEYCDECQLSARERLQLYLPVCHALQHAHHRGIIHRDLKPSNILVAQYDSQAVPKIIDFGVAKVVSNEPVEKTLFTLFGQVIGTIDYMSPEQAQLNQLDVDTRSDIYALGVVLYELLTGERPFDQKRLHRAALDELFRIIREEEPPKPSARLSGSGGRRVLAPQRGADHARLAKSLRGDVDRIVMKSLEKDRERRYSSAQAMAEDIQRHLSDHPVLASPPSALYRFRKFARRRRSSVLASFVIVAVTAFFLGLTGWVIRDRSVQQTMVKREVVAALEEIESMMRGGRYGDARAYAEQAESLAASLSQEEDLQEAVSKLRSEAAFVEQLDATSLVKSETAINGKQFDLYRAIPLYYSVFAENGFDFDKHSVQRLAARLTGCSDVCRDAVIAGIADLAYLVGAQHHSSLAGSSQYLSLYRSADVSLSGEQFTKLVNVLLKADHDPWRQQIWEALLAGDSDAIKELAQSDAIRAQPPAMTVVFASFVAAEDRFELLRATQQRSPGDFWANMALALALDQQETKIPADVIRYYAIAHALRPHSSGVRNNLANKLSSAGLEKDAERHYRAAIADDPDMLHAPSNLAYLLNDWGRFQEAETLLRKSLQQRPDEALWRSCYGHILQLNGYWERALEQYQQAFAVDPEDVETARLLAGALENTGRYDEAIGAYRKIVVLDPEDTEAASRQLALQVPAGQWQPEEGGDLAPFVAFLRQPNNFIFTAPNGPWVAFSMNEALVEQLRERLRPDGKEHMVWAVKGFADGLQGRWAESAFAFEAALQASPKEAGSQWWQSSNPMAVVLASWDEVYRRVRARRPDDHRVLMGRFRVLVVDERWGEAQAVIENLWQEWTPKPWDEVYQTYLALSCGDLVRYEQSCETMLAKWGTGHPLGLTSLICRACCLDAGFASRHKEQLRQLLAGLEADIASETRPHWKHHIRQSLGTGYYRLGDYDKARYWLRRVRGFAAAEKIRNRLILAQVAAAEGDRVEAQKFYQEAVETLQRRRPPAVLPPRPLSLGLWVNCHRWLACDQLLRETERRVEALAVAAHGL